MLIHLMLPVLVVAIILLPLARYTIKTLTRPLFALILFSMLAYGLTGMLALLTGISEYALFIASICSSAVITLIVIKYPEWYVLSIVCVLFSASTAVYLIILLSSIITPVTLLLPFIVLLLVVSAIFDYITVNITKHMVILGNALQHHRFPMFIIREMSGLHVKKISDRASRDSVIRGYFLAPGDAIVPAILVISVNEFMDAPYLYFINIPAIFTLAGTMLGCLVLVDNVLKKNRQQAGLPFLCTGAISGLAAWYAFIQFLSPVF